MRLHVLIPLSVVLLAAAGVLAWRTLDLPPVAFVVEHGLPPAGGPTGRTKTIEGVEFVEIGIGYFRMGSHFRCEKGDPVGRVCAALGLPWGKQPKHECECPLHWVRFQKPWWIARTEVTNEQYERFDPRRGRFLAFSGSDRTAALGFSREEARQYCDWLSSRGPLVVRLPSEAEWECACRAGSSTEFCFGDDAARLEEYAWFTKNFRLKTPHPVGIRRPNRWGLFDFHGNALEWCEDDYHESYRGAPADGSAWIDPGSPLWAFRGGCLLDPPSEARSASRGWFQPEDRLAFFGIRPAADPRQHAARASVIITEESLRFHHRAWTDDRGSFRVAVLPNAAYRVEGSWGDLNGDSQGTLDAVRPDGGEVVLRLADRR